MRIAHRTIVAALFLSAAALLAPAVRAADATAPAADLPILRIVPEDALAVVIVPQMDKADAQIAKLAAEMQIPIPASLLPMLKSQAGVQEGLDDHGSAALAIMPAEAADGAPFAVGAVAVTDYKKFIGQLHPEDDSAEITKITVMSDSCLVGHKDGFAVFAPSGKKEFLKKILDGTRPVGPVIGALSSWIGAHEVSFVATPSGVKFGTAAARKALTQIKAALANAPDENTKMAAKNLEIYERFLESAEKETSGFALGAHVDNDGGLHLDTRTALAANGTWAAAGKGSEHPAGTKLATLPGGPFMFAFDGTMPKSFSNGSLLSMSLDSIDTMSKAGGGKEFSDADRKKLEALMEKSMADMQSMAMVMGPPKPGSSLFGNMAATIKVKNAAQYLANYQQSIEAIAPLMKPAGFDYDVKKTKIDDLDGLELTMDMQAMFKKMPNPAAGQMLQMMFGADGKMKVYMAPIDDTTVATSYVNSDNIARIKSACQHPQTSLAAEPGIEQTAKLLPPGSQWVVYISPKGLFDFGFAMWKNVAPPGQPMPAIPAFPETAPLGIGAELSSKALDLNIVVPGAALKGVGTYIKQLQQMGRPAAPPQIR